MNPIRRQPALRRLSSRIVVGAAVLFSIVLIHQAVLAQGDSNEHWVGTWATAVSARLQPLEGQAQQTKNSPTPQNLALQAPRPVLNFNNQTLRQIVHASISGERVRVVLSNAFGTAPLALGAVRIALREKDAAIVPKSDRALTFGGRLVTTIPAGAVVVSDPVSLTVPALGDLAIDIYLPGDTAATSSPLTTHAGAQQTNYVSVPGDHTGAADMPVMTTTLSWFFLARVEVMAPGQVAAIVTLGDSITDGYNSTTNTNNRWPDHLAKRLMARSGNVKMAVLNAGISGNRVLTDGAGVSALARFDRDVLVQTGVTHVIVLEGINDIGLAGQNPRPSAEEIIAGHRQLIERAHARGLKIYGATLTPFEGTNVQVANYWTPEGDATRQAVNQWIRTSRAYDRVIDFDAVVRDPSQPMRFLPQYDSGDHLHPSDAGYEAMSKAIDLELFRTGQRKTVVTR